jgi:hypothetical protein
MSDIFISYSRKDKEFVKKLHEFDRDGFLALETAWQRYRQALADLHDRTNELLTQATNQPMLTALDQSLLPEKLAEIKTLPAQASVPPVTDVTVDVTQPQKQESQRQSQQGLPHAFVVMPFGRKKGPDGRWIDFNSIYYQLIKPALEEAGFEPFRADEESVSGDIITDMFQELLLADLVLADLSIDNANVFYELGIRHALRKRGLVHIQCGRAYMPYDIFNVRTIPYQCDENGCPDPQYLEKDKQAIIKIARATWESDENRIPTHPLSNWLLAGVQRVAGTSENCSAAKAHRGCLIVNGRSLQSPD